MPQSRVGPYFKYAIEALPRNSRIENAVAEYLGFRLSKNPNLKPKIWELCIDELVVGLNIQKTDAKRQLRVIGDKHKKHPEELIDQIVYLFQVATNRGYNHVFITSEKDAAWNNISYYQDPYWSRERKEHKKELEAILNGKRR